MADLEILRALGEELSKVVTPLETAFSSPQAFSAFLREYGWVVDPAILSLADLQNGIGKDISSAIEATRELLTKPLSEFTPEKYLSTLNRYREIFPKIYSLATTSAPQGLTDEIWASFSEDLPHGLITHYLATYRPTMLGFLIMTGVITEISVDVGNAVNRINYTKHIIEWERIPEIVTNPGGLAKKVYGGDSTHPFDYSLLLTNLARALPLFSLPASLHVPPTSHLDNFYDSNNPARSQTTELSVQIIGGNDGDGNGAEISLVALPVPDEPSGTPEGVVLFPSINVTGNAPALLFWPFSVELEGNFQLDQAIFLVLRPPDTPQVVRGSFGTINAAMALSQQSRYPLVIVGSRYSHRIQFFGWKAGLRVQGPTDDLEVAIELALRELQGVIQSASADDFLQKIFGSEPQVLTLDGSIIWSSKTGLQIKGSAGLELNIPINRNFGIAEIFTLHIGLQYTRDTLNVLLAVSGQATIGPVVATVSKVGAKLELRPVRDGEKPGLLGKLDLGFGFKSPDGLGIRVNAGPITGGGFLEIDEPNGRYAGILQLSIGTFGITAVGLLDTKLPGGARGFSFLLIITVKFAPIQLGFGFALTGLGGLAGIHRSMVQQALQDGVRNQSLDGIMFPDDPVKNAPRLINDLRTIFPPTENIYVFGPLARLIWGGAKVIIEAELGVILQLPDPLVIVILGQFDITLPDKNIEIKVVELHLDVVGIIDITNKHLSIDASLHHSRVGVFDISGDMAMRLSWGDTPSFLLSVGGFNPHFQPPPNMPELRRLTLSLSDGDNPHLSLEAYFAITSNTVQFGARAELYASAFGFSINGWIGFDALFYFLPRFAFRIDLDAGLTIKRGRTVVASIHFAASLTGPSPWHIWGEAVFSVIFEFRVPFDSTFGDTEQIEENVAKTRADVWSILKGELTDHRNWSSALPPNTQQVVSFTTEGDKTIIDPRGGLIVRQRRVPLGRTLTKFGEAALEESIQFDVPGSPDILDYFAPGQFVELDDAQKLSRPSFEKMRSGLTIVPNSALQYGKTQATDFNYETFVIDTLPEPEPVVSFLTLAELLAGNLVYRGSGLEAYTPSHLAEPLLTLRDEEYSVLNRVNVPEPRTKDAAYQAAEAYAQQWGTNPPTVVLSYDLSG